MKLASVFVVFFGIGVLSYPAMHTPKYEAFFAEGGKKQARLPTPNLQVGNRPSSFDKADSMKMAEHGNGGQAEPAPRKDTSRKEYALNSLKNIVSDDGEAKEDDTTGVEPKYRIIINIPATMLTLYEDGKEVMEIPVAVGEVRYRTPISHQEVKTIEWNPWWYPPKSDWAKNDKITPPGPKNPLGPVKMPMNEDIRMHGTTKPNSIGRAASHGCIRMNSADAVTLAWYLQSHLTKENDPALLEKYKKHGSRTFRVKLDEIVPVDIIYNPVIVEEDVIHFYPDLYGKVKDKDVKDMVEWALFASGIDPHEMDVSSIKKPKGKLAKIEVKELFVQ